MNRSLFFIVITACFIGGCSAQKGSAPAQPSILLMEAQFTPKPIQLDGKLSEPVWKTTPVYRMNLARDRVNSRDCLQEGGEIRLAWDHENLYIGIKFFDSDLVAQGTADQEPHFQLGDVAEIFLKPQKDTWYWELYVTPAGKKTRYWFSGCGRLGLTETLSYPNKISVAAQCQGTLNDYKDTDQSWTAEMIVPIAEITSQGNSFGPDTPWMILIGRYNYSRYMPTPGPEISTVPQLSTTSLHRTGEYARLVLQKPKD